MWWDLRLWRRQAFTVEGGLDVEKEGRGYFSVHQASLILDVIRCIFLVLHGTLFWNPCCTCCKQIKIPENSENSKISYFSYIVSYTHTSYQPHTLINLHYTNPFSDGDDSDDKIEGSSPENKDDGNLDQLSNDSANNDRRLTTSFTTKS